MHNARVKPVGLLGLVVGLGFLLTGCGAAVAGGGEGKLSGSTITVGSKNFTEQLVLGEITMQVLESEGATVEDRTGLGGSSVARNALTGDGIDMYWEYTGTGWITFLGETEPVQSPDRQFEVVAEQDLQQNDIKWLSPYAPANNTYAFAVRSEAYEDLGVEELSDFEQLVEENPEEATACAASEFLGRDDGLPGMEEAYDFEFEEVSELTEGAIYQATDQGDRCNFGEVFETDGRIEALDLRIIEDDKDFFPVYNPALNVREEVYDENPEIEEIIAPISRELDTETLRELNARVDDEGVLPDLVAEEWLQEEGFIE